MRLKHGALRNLEFKLMPNFIDEKYLKISFSCRSVSMLTEDSKTKDSNFLSFFAKHVEFVFRLSTETFSSVTQNVLLYHNTRSMALKLWDSIFLFGLHHWKMHYYTCERFLLQNAFFDHYSSMKGFTVTTFIQRGWAQRSYNSWSQSFQNISTLEVVNITRWFVHMDSSREHG